MRLFKGKTPDPYAGLSPETRAWVDRCKQYYLMRLSSGSAIAYILSSPEMKRMRREMKKNKRAIKAKALKDFKRFAEHLDDRGVGDEDPVVDKQERAKGFMALNLVDDIADELKHRGLTLVTANAVLDAIESALTPEASTRLAEGRPAGEETEAVLFLWTKLKKDGLSCMREASRVIAYVLHYRVESATAERFYQTIRNSEIKRK